LLYLSHISWETDYLQLQAKRFVWRSKELGCSCNQGFPYRCCWGKAPYQRLAASLCRLPAFKLLGCPTARPARRGRQHATVQGWVTAAGLGSPEPQLVYLGQLIKVLEQMVPKTPR